MKKPIISAISVVSTMMFVSCGGTIPTDDVPLDSSHADAVTDTFSMDDLIRLNQIQVKGTHNSYKIATDYCPPEWCLTMPALDVQIGELGARTVELDVHLNADGTLDVYHLAYFDNLTTCAKFKDCLALVKGWSESHAGHLPIVIMVEPKDEQDEEALKLTGKLNLLETEILSVFDRSAILAPDDVRGTHATLNEAITTEGWPLLRDCRDKVMFMMLDRDDHRQKYLEDHPNLAGALFFARDGRGESWSAILEMSDPDTQEEEDALKAAVLENYLVRVTVDDPQTTFAEFEPIAAATLRAGVQLINTDHPDESTVPEPEGGPFRFDIPGGNPARCNPVNAPEGCTSEIVEDLQ